MERPRPNQDQLDYEYSRRAPHVNRPTKGKTARKRRLPPHGTKTNVGDPNHNKKIV